MCSSDLKAFFLFGSWGVQKTQGDPPTHTFKKKTHTHTRRRRRRRRRLHVGYKVIKRDSTSIDDHIPGVGGPNGAKEPSWMVKQRLEAALHILTTLYFCCDDSLRSDAIICR